MNFSSSHNSTLEDLENQRKRLIFRAGHRGTKEMDLLLGGFAAKFVPQFTKDQLDDFEAFLIHNDPDLYNWITGQEEAPPEIVSLSFFRDLRTYRHV
jgi:antitoxin CptB